MGTKEDCCICPIPFSWFWTLFSTICLLKLWFFMNLLSWRLATSATVFGMPWNLNMHHSSNFDTFFPVKINQMWNFAWNCDFSGTAYRRDSKPVYIAFGMPQTLNIHHSSNFWYIFPCQSQPNVKFCLKLWFFRNLIAETQNLWHCIWHASNPKYTPLKQFRCIFPSQNQQMWNFAWICDFSETAYCRDSKPMALAFSMPQTLNMCNTQAILMHFSQSKSRKCEILAVSLTPPDKTKLKICINLHREKVFAAHIGFWVCQLLCTMLELCVRSTFWVIMVFSIFMGRSRYRVLQHGVEVKWEPRRTAAYVPSHFHGFEPHFLLCIS